MKRLGELPILQKLKDHADPVVRLKAARLAPESSSSEETEKLRNLVKRGDMTQSLLAHRLADGTVPTNPYRKWQGPHWTLYSLAQIGYPAGDRSLHPMRNQMYDWLLDEKHLRFPRSMVFPGQADRFRRCASQEGNAVWYSIVLGIDDGRTRDLVHRLTVWQWPDGGWNCDKDPHARRSSVIESLVPLRALFLAGKTYRDGEALEAAAGTADFFLERRLFRRLRNGAEILQSFRYITYPIQFYDVLFILTVMVEIGRIKDPRCSEALDILESKMMPDGGFPLERCNARTSPVVTTRGTYADWGPSGKRTCNPFVTADALWVLAEAGRFSR